jgi:hypothetical protein
LTNFKHLFTDLAPDLRRLEMGVRWASNGHMEMGKLGTDADLEMGGLPCSGPFAEWAALPNGRLIGMGFGLGCLAGAGSGVDFGFGGEMGLCDMGIIDRLFILIWRWCLFTVPLGAKW